MMNRGHTFGLDKGLADAGRPDGHRRAVGRPQADLSEELSAGRFGNPCPQTVRRRDEGSGIGKPVGSGGHSTG